MYTLRTYTNDGVETNTILGKNYQVFKFEKRQKTAFEDQFKSIFKESFDKEKHETRCIIVGDSHISCLAEKQKAYIMSANGETFSKISYKS